MGLKDHSHEEDQMKKMCFNENATTVAKAMGANLHMASHYL